MAQHFFLILPPKMNSHLLLPYSTLVLILAGTNAFLFGGNGIGGFGIGGGSGGAARGGCCCCTCCCCVGVGGCAAAGGQLQQPSIVVNCASGCNNGNGCSGGGCAGVSGCQAGGCFGGRGGGCGGGCCSSAGRANSFSGGVGCLSTAAAGGCGNANAGVAIGCPAWGCARDCRECTATTTTMSADGGGVVAGAGGPYATAFQEQGSSTADGQPRYVIVSQAADVDQQQPQPISGGPLAANDNGQHQQQVNNVQQSTAPAADCGGGADGPAERMPDPLPYPPMVLPSEDMAPTGIAQLPTPSQEMIPSIPMGGSATTDYTQQQQQQQQQQQHFQSNYQHRAASVATKKSPAPSAIFGQPLVNSGGDDDNKNDGIIAIKSRNSGSGVCNSAELRQLMDTQMVEGDANASKRRIHSAANSRTATTITTTATGTTKNASATTVDDVRVRRQSNTKSTTSKVGNPGGAAEPLTVPTAAGTARTGRSNSSGGGRVRGFDVICAPGVFSYRIATDLYCEHTKRNVTCFAYLQQP